MMYSLNQWRLMITVKTPATPSAPVGVVITRRECQLGDMDVFSICFVIAALISNKWAHLMDVPSSCFKRVGQTLFVVTRSHIDFVLGALSHLSVFYTWHQCYTSPQLSNTLTSDITFFIFAVFFFTAPTSVLLFLTQKYLTHISSAPFFSPVFQHIVSESN